ncbi:TPA: hypothetical protein ACH3X1_013103 [Trebouxia sp. C0004]
MIHLVAAIRANGPCWVWAMFGFEKPLGEVLEALDRLDDTEVASKGHHLQCTLRLQGSMPSFAEQLLADQEQELWEGHGAQSVSTAFSHDLQTFDHQTNELILPSFLQANQGVSADSHGFVPFGFGKKFSNYNVREFVQRKAKADFRSNAAQTDKTAIEQMWMQAKRDLEVAKRQTLVYSLYGSRQKSVMDIPMVKVLQQQAEDAPYTTA